jgi:hypothetical protein
LLCVCVTLTHDLSSSKLSTSEMTVFLLYLLSEMTEGARCANAYTTDTEQDEARWGGGEQGAFAAVTAIRVRSPTARHASMLTGILGLQQ